MILTDREIQIAIKEQAITISPNPEVIAYSSTSVDLTLDPSISICRSTKDGMEKAFDPAVRGFNPEKILADESEQRAIDKYEGFLLKPRVLVLGWTVETVDLKISSRVAARVEGKSSLARLGLVVHLTAPTIHAGFKGRIRLEMINQGPLPIRLRVGMRVCQLIFEQTLGTASQGYQGMFAGQTVLGS
ncbi:MAG TPA: dCTP deaminase [Aestuariivirgaceae bacterium]|nr:dCTP deaminase [Aestuariivirgaceae bacterium]